MNSIAKVVFVGDTRVGKTSIINKYAKKNDKTSPTIGANSFCFSIPLDSEIVTLSVWDTAGQEEFKCLVPMYARGAQVAVVVFDLSSKESYEGIFPWIKTVREDYDILNIIVVGNKNDLETFTNTDEIVVKYGDEVLKFLSVSAETGSGIDDLFSLIAMNTKNYVSYKPTAINCEMGLDKKNECC